MGDDLTGDLVKCLIPGIRDFKLYYDQPVVRRNIVSNSALKFQTQRPLEEIWFQTGVTQSVSQRGARR